MLVVVLPHWRARRQKGGQQDGAKDRAQPPRPPLVDIGGRAVEVLVVALLLGQLVELEQGEGLFDAECDLGVVHFILLLDF